VERAENGPPAETIDRVAREVGAHQIIVGPRGLDTLSAPSQPRCPARRCPGHIGEMTKAMSSRRLRIAVVETSPITFRSGELKQCG
jgi:hypothetical protein